MAGHSGLDERNSHPGHPKTFQVKFQDTGSVKAFGRRKLYSVSANRKIMPNKLAGVICLIGGLGCNKFVLEAVFSGDGKISALPVNIGILVLQVALISAGVLYMKQWYPLLAKIGVGVVILFALQFWVRVGLEIPFPEKRMFAALPFPPSLFKAGLDYQDQISRYEKRFAGIKKMLPARGVVGYLTFPNLSWDEAKFDYGLTGYALSPLNVDWSPDHEWIVGNFPNFKSPVQIPDIAGFVLIRDFGNGVALFKRELRK